MPTFSWRQTLVAMVLAGAAQAACAAWVSIKITAPTDGGGPYTDVHFYTNGDGESEGFESQVANDFSSALSNGYTSHRINHASVGMVYGDSQPEAICFFFSPTDLLQEGEMLEIVLDLAWVDEADDPEATANFNLDNARFSRAGGLLFGSPGPTIRQFDIGNIALARFEPIRMRPGGFDGRVLELNQVPVPASLWLAMLGFVVMGRLSVRRRTAAHAADAT